MKDISLSQGTKVSSSLKKEQTTPTGIKSSGSTENQKESMSAQSTRQESTIQGASKSSLKIQVECLKILQEDLRALIEVGFDVQIIPELQPYDFPIIALRGARLIDGEFEIKETVAETIGGKRRKL